jgi:hypothetical protein
MQIQLKHFLISDLKNLQKEFFLWAQTLVTGSNSIPLPQHDLPIHKMFVF